jgi:hypothetical protein
MIWCQSCRECWRRSKLVFRGIKQNVNLLVMSNHDRLFEREGKEMISSPKVCTEYITVFTVCGCYVTNWDSTVDRMISWKARIVKLERNVCRRQFRIGALRLNVSVRSVLRWFMRTVQSTTAIEGRIAMANADGRFCFWRTGLGCPIVQVKTEFRESEKSVIKFTSRNHAESGLQQ